MGVDFNLKEIENLKKNIEWMQNHTEEMVEKALTSLAGECFRRAVKNTPVDTGRLKGSWRLGPIRWVFGEAFIKVYADEAVAPYAMYVENGHRIVGVDGVTLGWKDGVFMLKIAEKEVNSIKAKIVKREMARLLKGRLG